MKIFCFAPVLRKGSFNKKLIRIAKAHAEEFPGTEVELSEFNDFPMPMYDGDIETGEGIPEAVKKLAEKISAADAIIISSPEYNGSIPGTFKNAIDWLSRLKPVPLSRKQILLIGASTSQFASIKGNFHARVPFHVLGAFVYPDFFGVAFAEKAFDDKDQLKDQKQNELLKKTIMGFLKYASRAETPFDRLNEFVEEQIHSHDDNRPH
ncbi:NAD(P)H-dependent oxidoreductase [Bdellovibrio sp. SKB1291214]|uniref:NADPH-dependent FMN reductase n=1 Tax=Bdellovibrio sp. SKB1291214 TaxID=1732569 RepID=UPI000B517650|nr:NAD(P)H-dependent oxidoreductase [Bdellovibrio sp. SKB1291214]UYL08176.1 NAD(P)H-dependent oxidoreductase [Bdellovibrio sp. SKB1291214]